MNNGQKLLTAGVDLLKVGTGVGLYAGFHENPEVLIVAAVAFALGVVVGIVRT